MTSYSDWIQPDDYTATVGAFNPHDYTTFVGQNVNHASGWSAPMTVDPNPTLAVTDGDSSTGWVGPRDPDNPPLSYVQSDIAELTDGSTGWSESATRQDFSVSVGIPSGVLNPVVPSTWPTGSIGYEVETPQGVPTAASVTLTILEGCGITTDGAASGVPLDPAQAPVRVTLGTIAATGSEVVDSNLATSVYVIDSGTGGGGDGYTWNVAFDVPSVGQYGFHVVPRSRRVPPPPPWSTQTVNREMHIGRSFTLQTSSTVFTIHPPRYRWIFGGGQVAPCRLHPREDGRGVGAGHVWPPSRAAQTGSRVGGGYF